MRTRVPFIEAFRQKESGEERKDDVGVGRKAEGGGVPQVKRMRDSFHRVVSWSCDFFVFVLEMGWDGGEWNER